MPPASVSTRKPSMTVMLAIGLGAAVADRGELGEAHREEGEQLKRPPSTRNSAPTTKWATATRSSSPAPRKARMSAVWVSAKGPSSRNGTAGA